MVKWKHRSEEDKKCILEEQTTMRERGQRSPGQKLIEKTQDRMNELYEQGEIPIFCMKCNRHTHSDRYIIEMRHHPMIGREILHVVGHCVKCKGEIERPFPSSPGEMMFIGAVMMKLQCEGRLEDRRPVKK